MAPSADAPDSTGGDGMPPAHDGPAAGVDATALDMLRAAGRVRSLERGAVVWHDGMAAMPSGLLLSGLLRHQRYGADGHRQILNLILPGEFLHSRALERPGYSVEAAEPSTLLTVHPAAFETIVGGNRSLARAVTQSLRTHLDRLRWHILLILGLDVEGRLCAFLSCAAGGLRPVEILPSGNPLVTLSLPRGDLADLLSTGVDALCRSLESLERRGMIRMPAPNRVELLDPEGVRRRGRAAGMGEECIAWPKAVPTPRGRTT